MERDGYSVIMNAARPEIRLICLDFDGTAVDYDGEQAFFHPVVASLLNELEEQGIAWCTNSGRSMEDQARILRVSRVKGLRHAPSALLCSEAFIFEPSEEDYRPSEPWNSNTAILMRRFHERVQKLVTPKLDDWKKRFAPDVRLGEGYTVFCVPGENGVVDQFAAELAATLKKVPHLTITRNGGWVVALPDQVGKGNLLRQYLKQARMSPDAVLAVGDHLNDLSMLDGRAAAYVGCPASAEPEVVKTVNDAGGCVAESAGPEGTAEIIRFYVSGGSHAG